MKIDILVKFCTFSFGCNFKGTPPSADQIWSICVQECSGVPNLQIELNYLDSFKSYCIFTDFMVPTSPWSPCCPHGLNVVPMLFSHCPHHPHCHHMVPTLPWLCLHGLHSMVFPHYPHHSYIIPTSSRRSPTHPQSSRYPPSPLKGGPESVKIQ